MCPFHHLDRPSGYQTLFCSAVQIHLFTPPSSGGTQTEEEEKKKEDEWKHSTGAREEGCEEEGAEKQGRWKGRRHEHASNCWSLGACRSPWQHAAPCWAPADITPVEAKRVCVCVCLCLLEPIRLRRTQGQKQTEEEKGQLCRFDHLLGTAAYMWCVRACTRACPFLFWDERVCDISSKTSTCFQKLQVTILPLPLTTATETKRWETMQWREQK